MHMAQLMPLPLTVSCFSKIQIGFTFLVPSHPGGPGKRAIKWMYVCVCVSLPLLATWLSVYLCVSVNVCDTGCIGSAVQHAFSAVAGRVEHCSRWRHRSCRSPVFFGNVAVSTAVIRHHSVRPRAVRRHAGSSQRHTGHGGVRRPSQHVYWIHRVTDHWHKRRPV